MAPPSRERLIAYARQQARRQGLPEDIYLAQLNQESGFRPDARSYADARGVAQIVPRWHPDINPNKPGNQLPGVNPFRDIDYSTRLMAGHLEKYGSIERALSAYNSGKPDAYKDPSFAKGQTHDYVAKILAGRKNWKGSSTPLGQLTATAHATGARSTSPASVAAPRQDDTDLRRRALMQSLIGQQSAYLAREDYSGPSAMQLYQQSKAVAPAAEPLGALQTPEGRNIPVVSEVKGKPAKGASKIVAAAQRWLGTPYSWGGGGPGGPSTGFAQGAGIKGFDCSSLLQYAYAQQGKQIPRVTYDQWRSGKAVGKQNLRPGDAVFFNPGSRGPEHVGIYAGNGQYIQAPKTGDVVKISKLSDRSDYMGARRW